MEEALEVQMEVYKVSIPALQLRQIDLPDDFEDALRRVEVARQEIEIALLQQSEALVRAETLVLEAQAQAEIKVLEAQAEGYLSKAKDILENNLKFI